jgi:predicted oxidoreductase
MAEGLTVTRMGYGAMQLAGPYVFGPPADRDAAVAVLREAVHLGITHIDTADAYGPHITNQIIKEALHPYPNSLHVVTKVGVIRDAEGGWPPARTPEQLRAQVHDNLRNLGLDVLEVVNLRVGGLDRPAPGSIAEPFTALVQMQQEGLIKHLGISNVNAEQVAEVQSIAPIVCVQNHYNLAHEGVDVLDAPVSGGRPAAQTRTLTTMVGGPQPVAQRCEALFSSFSQHVVYLGGPGSGQTAKLFNNALLIMNQANIADIVDLAIQLGMDPSSLVDVLKLGSAASRALTLLNSMVRLDNVDHLSKVEELDMQLFDTAMTESGVNADFVTARGLVGARGLPALLRRLNV